MNLQRSLNLSLLVLFIFTQGLSFKVSNYFLIPVYCVTEVSRSVAFLNNQDLENYHLMKCCSILFMTTMILVMSNYVVTFSQMQQFYSTDQAKKRYLNLSSLFDKFDEGLLLYKHYNFDEQNEKVKALSESKNLRAMGMPETKKSCITDIKLCNRSVTSLIGFNPKKQKSKTKTMRKKNITDREGD